MAEPQTIKQCLDSALREIELLLITTPWTERESRIYSIASRALNLADGEAAREAEAAPGQPSASLEMCCCPDACHMAGDEYVRKLEGGSDGN